MTDVQPSIEELREEFARNDLRGWLWLWIQRVLIGYIIRRIRGSYRPQVYSPTGEWDDAGCADLANQFILERGIRKGAIARALFTAQDTPGLIAYLSRSLKRFAIAGRPSSMRSNVFERLRDVLDQRPAFIRLAGVPPYSRYGLADWESDPPPEATDETLIDASRYLPEIGWVVYTSGTRQSPGISSDDLELIAHELLLGTNRLFTSKQIMAVISRRYALDNEFVGGDLASLEAVIPPSQRNPLEEAEANDLAEKAFEAFTPRQRRIVRMMLEEPESISTRDLASKLQISKSTAASELIAIQKRFRLLGASSEDVQLQILEALWPKLKAG